ncbi:MAG: non-canonical purine NTP pyrophosphatase [Gemmatimonadota bacterium]
MPAGSERQRVLVATRNHHKLNEIRGLLAGLDIELISPDDVALATDPAEDDLEVHSTFVENALAKARYFHGRSGLPALADDSGLCVDALDGRPGVHSRRFAPEEPNGQAEQDAANNRHLLALLSETPAADRGASFRCALALVEYGRELTVEGRVDGSIAEGEIGEGGFGYDPLFIVPEFGRTFGELPEHVKAARSHRADAVRQLKDILTDCIHNT